jgi:hypothetical protein
MLFGILSEKTADEHVEDFSVLMLKTLAKCYNIERYTFFNLSEALELNASGATVKG